MDKNMEFIYIFGINNYSKNICYQVHKHTCIKIKGFVVDYEYINSSPKEYCGLPVKVFDDIPINNTGIFIGLGFRNMNEGRKKIFIKCKQKGIKILNFIHPSACVDTENIGEGNMIFHQAIIGEDAVIGDGNIFRGGTLLAHDSLIGNFNYFAPHACIGGETTIGSLCFFGLNSTVKSKVEIGDKVLIGANTYVSKNIKDNKVLVPQRAIELEGKSGTDFL